MQHRHVVAARMKLQLISFHADTSAPAPPVQSPVPSSSYFYFAPRRSLPARRGCSFIGNTFVRPRLPGNSSPEPSCPAQAPWSLPSPWPRPRGTLSEPTPSGTSPSPTTRPSCWPHSATGSFAYGLPCDPLSVLCVIGLEKGIFRRPRFTFSFHPAIQKKNLSLTQLRSVKICIASAYGFFSVGLALLILLVRVYRK